ncbi:hypothetical protein RB195_002374 [Necator americanus]|uniref:Phospholipid scramblase n=1 Tax=Necator americanus TaxID=51031 RepID=A0ABR1DIS3_NECAM
MFVQGLLCVCSVESDNGNLLVTIRKNRGFLIAPGIYHCAHRRCCLVNSADVNARSALRIGAARKSYNPPQKCKTPTRILLSAADFFSEEPEVQSE